jgi:Sec-independent protein secretion pathway component TatC
MKRVFVAAAAAALGTAIYLPVAFAGATGSGAVTSQAPRYEWQYHYVGHHPRYEGHWVLVP